MKVKLGILAIWRISAPGAQDWPHSDGAHPDRLPSEAGAVMVIDVVVVLFVLLSHLH